MSDAGASRPMQTRRASRKVVWGARIGYVVLRLLALTWRVRLTNDAPWRALKREGKPYIFALWHGELLPLLWAHRGGGHMIMVSEHGDGEIVARLIARLGLGTVRGSTTRGGSRALLGIIRVLESGQSAAFTPDGPRGPRHVWQPGILSAARRAPAPIVCIGIAVNRAWRTRGWDQFVIPKPFARITVVYSDPEPSTAADLAVDSARFTEVMHVIGQRAAEQLRHG
jgi:hypothetical protein